MLVCNSDLVRYHVGHSLSPVTTIFLQLCDYTMESTVPKIRYYVFSYCMVEEKSTIWLMSSWVGYIVVV